MSIQGLQERLVVGTVVYSDGRFRVQWMTGAFWFSSFHDRLST